MSLQYIITQRERNLSVIRADLYTLQEELSTFSDVETFDNWDQKVNEQMMEYETNLISKKSGKFERDRLNSLNNREFNWKKQNTNTKNNKNKSKMNSKQPIEIYEQDTLSQGHNSFPLQTDRQRSNYTIV